MLVLESTALPAGRAGDGARRRYGVGWLDASELLSLLSWPGLAAGLVGFRGSTKTGSNYSLTTSLLQVTTGYCRLLQVTTGYHMLLPVTTGCYRLLQVTTWYYMLLQVNTG